MLAFLSYVFVIADIAIMRLVNPPDTWAPIAMTDTTPLPKIAGFSSMHDPARLYAELLRQYISTPSRLGLTSNLPAQQWFSRSEASGYFCRHDGFLSFVPGLQDLANNQQGLQKILDSFKSKYLKIDWTSTPVTEQQKTKLQAVVTAHKNSKKLLESVLQTAEEFGNNIKPYDTKCPILYDGIFTAAPHVHRYEPLLQANTRRTFKHTSSGIFIEVAFELVLDSRMLYRPHAYLVFTQGITPEIYKQKNSWIQWDNIQVSVVYADGTGNALDYNGPDNKWHPVCMHDVGGQAVASSNNLAIGKFSDLLAKGPFISHMTAPYDVKTLHILVDDMSNISDTEEDLRIYLSQLPLEQQKFIIKQLFPFLTV